MKLGRSKNLLLYFYFYRLAVVDICWQFLQKKYDVAKNLRGKKEFQMILLMNYGKRAVGWEIYLASNHLFRSSKNIFSFLLYFFIVVKMLMQIRYANFFAFITRLRLWLLIFAWIYSEISYKRVWVKAIVLREHDRFQE